MKEEKATSSSGYGTCKCDPSETRRDVTGWTFTQGFLQQTEAEMKTVTRLLSKGVVSAFLARRSENQHYANALAFFTFTSCLHSELKVPHTCILNSVICFRACRIRTIYTETDTRASTAAGLGPIEVSI